MPKSNGSRRWPASSRGTSSNPTSGPVMCTESPLESASHPQEREQAMKDNAQRRLFQPAVKPRPARPIPRGFEFPWGRGHIVEEASHRGEHHEPCLQLLTFDDGREILRLCSYTLGGRFERNSWLAGPDELRGLRKALQSTPRIRAHLQQLLSPSFEHGTAQKPKELKPPWSSSPRRGSAAGARARRAKWSTGWRCTPTNTYRR